MPVRALVVSTTAPPVTGQDVEGLFKRFRVSIGAVGAVADQVDAVHFLPRRVVAGFPGAEGGAPVRLTYWDTPISARLVAQGERTKTFLNFYAKGVLSAAQQPAFHGAAGGPQAAFLGAILDKAYDLVFVHRFAAMCAVLRTGRRAGHQVFDLDDVEHLVRVRASLQPPAQPGKLISLAHVPAILAAERAGAARSRFTLVCSDLDKAKLRRVGVAHGVTVVPNAVPIPAAPPPLPPESTLLYIGDYGYEPNREAGERLATRILPLIRQAVPAATLLLAGKRSERLGATARSQPGVECVGFVESLDAIYARARIVCCPISNGGGTRLKIIEAAAYRRPIVSTRIGAEGLDFADGSEILLHDDDAGLAAACARLIGDGALCERLGTAGRERAIQDYRADHVQDQLAGLLRSAMA